MNTEVEYEPHVTVETACVLIIDPCYVADLLNLTKEQSEVWDKKVLELRGGYRPFVVNSVPIDGIVQAMLLSLPGDALYSAENIATYLGDPEDPISLLVEGLDKRHN